MEIKWPEKFGILSCQTRLSVNSNSDSGKQSGKDLAWTRKEVLSPAAKTPPPTWLLNLSSDCPSSVQTLQTASADTLKQNRYLTPKLKTFLASRQKKKHERIAPQMQKTQWQTKSIEELKEIKANLGPTEDIKLRL